MITDTLKLYKGVDFEIEFTSDADGIDEATITLVASYQGTDVFNKSTADDVSVSGGTITVLIPGAETEIDPPKLLLQIDAEFTGGEKCRLWDGEIICYEAA